MNKNTHFYPHREKESSFQMLLPGSDVLGLVIADCYIFYNFTSLLRAELTFKYFPAHYCFQDICVVLAFEL